MNFKAILLLTLTFLITSPTNVKASIDCSISVDDNNLHIGSALIEKGYNVVSGNNIPSFTLNTEKIIVKRQKPYIYSGNCTYSKSYDVVSITKNDSGELIASEDSSQYWSGWTCVNKKPISWRKDVIKNRNEAVINAIQKM